MGKSQKQCCIKNSEDNTIEYGMNKCSKKYAWIAHASISGRWLPPGRERKKEKEKRNEVLVVPRTFYS